MAYVHFFLLHGPNEHKPKSVKPAHNELAVAAASWAPASKAPCLGGYLEISHSVSRSVSRMCGDPPSQSLRRTFCACVLTSPTPSTLSRNLGDLGNLVT